MTSTSGGPAATGRPRHMTHDRVRELIGEPAGLAVTKVQRTIDPNFRRFIARSPFLCMATSNDDGSADCSPRGDQPGFVKVLDDTTIAIPDRIGNKRIDSFENILSRPGIGLIFLVPGHRETLRINGNGYLTEDPDLLPQLAARDKTPELALIVEVDEAYLHCGRAILRSKLWDPASLASPGEVPTTGEIMAAQLQRDEATAHRIDEDIEVAYQTLY